MSNIYVKHYNIIYLSEVNDMKLRRAVAVLTIAIMVVWLCISVPLLPDSNINDGDERPNIAEASPAWFFLRRMCPIPA